MQARPIRMQCPNCGAGEIVYTCEPKCCFNHACAVCATTFEPVTRATGERVSGVEPPEPLPDPSDPTAACGRCESIAVYELDDGRLLCTGCGAVLDLEYTNVAR